jgi:CRISPR-associated Cas5-like protein
MWSNAWFLVKQDYKRFVLGIIVSILLVLYFSGFSSFLAREILAGGGERPLWIASFLIDILFLSSMSTIGFIFNGEYGKYWITDVFTKKLLFMRMLPIDLRELLLARYIGFFINVVFLSAVYFSFFYVLTGFGQHYTFGQFMSFLLLWISFGICSGAFYIYKELGSNGKSYFIYSFAIVGVLIALSGATSGFGYGFFATSLRLAERFPLPSAIIGLLFAALWAIWWGRRTERKIRMREFAR